MQRAQGPTSCHLAHAGSSLLGMRGLVVLLVLLLAACNQIAELGEDAPHCGSRADCGPDETCIEGECFAVPHHADPDPALEKEADALGKLRVERDMLEAKVKETKRELDEAIEELGDAKSESEKSAAQSKKSQRAAAHQKAVEALEAFKKQH